MSSYFSYPSGSQQSQQSQHSQSHTSQASAAQTMSTEYDVPHPTLSRHQPRFYIPDRSAYSPSADHHTLHSRFPSLTTSGQSTPYDSLYGPSRRPSAAALRHALHNYHSYTPRAEPATPPHQISRLRLPPARDQAVDRPGGVVGLSGGSDDAPVPLPDDMCGIGERMEALVDIHRVLYRGNEGGAGSWSEQGREVQRVVDQWFEGDCVYDHPLVRISSRQSVLTHFALLQLLSTLYLPSLYPSDIISHARSLTAKFRTALCGSDELPRRSEKTQSQRDHHIDEWLATSARGHSAVMRRNNQDDGWWKLWDVSAECHDIGCMECYDGYHIALIDHVVSLTLFPSVLKRRSTLPCTPLADSSTSSPPAVQPSFVRTLAESVLHEFDFLMHWDLPVSTIVEFNEVGKATLVRDVVDVRDVIDTFVPFAKRFSWLSRRLAGLVSSTVGSVALTLMPGHTVVFGDPIRIAAKADDDGGDPRPMPLPSKHELLEPPLRLEPSPSPGEEPNSLGLEGMSSGMEPDVDEEMQE